MHLAEYMTERRLSDEEVAAALGRSRVSVSRYRRGLQRPDLELAQQIADWSSGAVPLESWLKSEAAE